MKPRTRLVSRTSMCIAAGQFFLAGVALAHDPFITATAVCDDSNRRLIDYTSFSWCSSNVDADGCSNPQIDILFNDVKVGQGEYKSPTFSFSGSQPAPIGSSAVVTALAVGVWSNGTAPGQSMSFVVPYPTEECTAPGLGRFTGGGHQIRVDGARVTRGLTIHCDLLLSNNLEINWQGSRFHMTEHLTTVACTDSPDIDQFPPAAPLDTLIGVGTGRYNGDDGYTVEFTLVDYGEPGTSDQMAIHIFETANPSNVKLDIPLQLLTGGNLQAHFDQPHK